MLPYGENNRAGGKKIKEKKKHAYISEGRMHIRYSLMYSFCVSDLFDQRQPATEGCVPGGRWAGGKLQGGVCSVSPRRWL